MEDSEINFPNETFLLTMSQRPVPSKTHSTDSISLQLKKSKEQASNAKKQLEEMVKRLHKLETTTTKHQKLSMMAKTKCLRLYQVKKHKLFNRTLQQQNKHRKQFLHEQQFQDIQKKRMQQQIVKDMVRSQQAYKRDQARQRMMNYKRSVHDQLQQVQTSMYESCRKVVEGVKKSKSRLAQRRKLIEEVILDRGRENYLAKLKQQFRSIQVYKDKIADLQQQSRQMEEFNRALSKYSRDSKRKTGVTSNNISFFLTEKKPQQRKMQSGRKWANQ